MGEFLFFMSSENKFFAGLEEIFARLLGVALTLTFFLIYIVAIKQLTLDWLQALVLLSIFWAIYETISLILFSVFNFFAKSRKASETAISVQATSEKDYQLPTDKTDQTSL